MFLEALWLPIILSAVAIWFLSFVLWVVLPIHKKDYQKLPDEDAVQNVLREQKVTPGLYNLPHVTSSDDLKSETLKAKIDAGPLALITVLPPNAFAMGKKLSLWFAQNLLIATFVAFLAHTAFGAEATYLQVFQFCAIVTTLAYGGAYLSEAIWFSRTWSVALKHVFDAFLYGLVTGGLFGWLW